MLQLFALACLGLLGVSFAKNENLLMVRQNAGKNGVLSLVNHDSAAVVKEAPVTFKFSWPYVEMTASKKDATIFVTTFPDNSSNAELYQYNQNLDFVHSWPDTDFWFFDLQYCENQQTLYGIKVTSSYGRTLSRFEANPTQTIVNATELFTLPYMWYVNASTFDQSTNRYFGLINYFPGQPGYTAQQKLVVCDFTTAAGDCKVIDIAAPFGTLHFISYGHATNQLYFASSQNVYGKQDKYTTIFVGTLEPETGKVKQLWEHPFVNPTAFGDYQFIGPLVFEESDSSLSLFMHEKVDAPWQLYKISSRGASKEEGKVVGSYENVEEYNMISAATKF